ncbi:MAG: GDP-mannose 4,6-dehydratase [Bdellovibrionota bacterium]
MAKFIVTGGAGFLGSHLVDKLLHEGHEVVVLDNLVTGLESNLSSVAKNPNLTWVYQDVSAPWHDHGKVDGIFHMASPASPIDFVPLSVEILKVGSLGTLHALEYAKKHGAWYFQASTSEVYGDPTVHPQGESYLGNVNCLGVRGVYDEAKRFSESLVTAFHRREKVRTSIVRIFNTYGPRMRKNDGRVIPNFITQALDNKPITIHGDGKQTRSFCYVDDLIAGIYNFWIHQPQGPINLGNPVERNMLDVANIILEKTNSKSKLVFLPLPEGDPLQRCPVIDKAKIELQWKPKVSFEDGIDKTIEYFKSVL